MNAFHTITDLSVLQETRWVAFIAACNTRALTEPECAFSSPIHTGTTRTSFLSPADHWKHHLALPPRIRIRVTVTVDVRVGIDLGLGLGFGLGLRLGFRL